MKLGLHIGYWGLGLTAPQQLELVLEAERLGYDSVWTAEAYGSDAATILALARAGDRRRSSSARRSSRCPAAARDDGDDRGDDRPALRRPDAARHRLERAAGGRGLARAAVRPAAAAHARVRRGRADGAARASASSSTARRSQLPLPDGPGKALKLTIAPVQERIPIYIAAIGPEEHDAGGRDRRRLAADAVLPRARRRVPAAAGGGLRARRRRQGLRRLRHRPDRHRDGLRRPRVRARRDAPLRRALRRRDGLAQAELLQRAGAALRLRGRGATRSRSCTWRAARTRRRRRCRAS